MESQPVFQRATLKSWEWPGYEAMESYVKLCYISVHLGAPNVLHNTRVLWTDMMVQHPVLNSTQVVKNGLTHLCILLLRFCDKESKGTATNSCHYCHNCLCHGYGWFKFTDKYRRESGEGRHQVHNGQQAHSSSVTITIVTDMNLQISTCIVERSGEVSNQRGT